MILRINGSISPTYVQTLCLLFFPGSKFRMDEQPAPGIPEADIALKETVEGYFSTAKIMLDGRVGQGEYRLKNADFPYATPERREKIAVGRAVLAAGKELLGYMPPWGILTGVRPSKVATELIESEGGVLRARRVLRDEYFVNPKKAAIATAVAQTEAKLMRRLPPQSGLCSVYISIPFCPSRCAYCSFVSNTSGRLLSLIGDYLKTLYLDIDNMFSVIRARGLRVASVYIGGGTPTVLEDRDLAELLARIGRHLLPDEAMEFTLEAGRPDTITKEKLAIAREAGVTRISVNPQTLSDELLTRIGRRHTVEDFYRAYDAAVCSGIRDINVDLIAGLPGDDFGNFSKTVDAILGLAPTNITVHSFSVKNAASIRQSGPDVATLTAADHTHLARSIELAEFGITVESRVVRLAGQDVPRGADLTPDMIPGFDPADSCGGVIECVAKGLPAGLGEPVFDKLDAEIAKAVMSIGAVKGVEIGDGFAASRALGSENNDSFRAGAVFGILSRCCSACSKVAIVIHPLQSTPKDASSFPSGEM